MSFTVLRFSTYNIIHCTTSALNMLQSANKIIIGINSLFQLLYGIYYITIICYK